MITKSLKNFADKIYKVAHNTITERKRKVSQNKNRIKKIKRKRKIAKESRRINRRKK